MDCSQLLINQAPDKVENIILNEGYTLEKFFENNAVYKIKNEKNQDTKWVLKLYKNQELAEDEIDSLYKARNVIGIPKIVSFSTDGNIKYLIMTRVKGADLFTLLETGFTMKIFKKIVREILLILIDLHSLGITHQDIKPENIMFDPETEEVSIVDFEKRVTPDYFSPEYIMRNSITEKYDVWCLGTMCYYITEKKFPFANNRGKTSKSPIKLSSNREKNFIDFVLFLLEREEDLRPTAQEALNHPWLN